MDDVLGVELDVEPGAAIRNDTGSEQQLARRMGLALVVIEEHAGRTVHLRDDDALGAVDDERAVVGHQRDVAHVDILLLDVLHGARAGLLVDIEHDQPQLHLERRSVGHAALAAFVDVILRRIEFVSDEIELRGVGEILDREHRLEDSLQPLVGPPARRLLHQQELIVGCLLNLNEVRHLCNFMDFSEKLSYALATRERLRHRFLSVVVWSGRPARLSGKPQSIATIRTSVRLPTFLDDSGTPEPPQCHRRCTAMTVISRRRTRNHRFVSAIPGNSLPRLGLATFSVSAGSTSLNR